MYLSGLLKKANGGDGEGGGSGGGEVGDGGEGVVVDVTSVITLPGGGVVTSTMQMTSYASRSRWVGSIRWWYGRDAD